MTTIAEKLDIAIERLTLSLEQMSSGLSALARELEDIAENIDREGARTRLIEIVAYLDVVAAEAKDTKRVLQ